MGLGGDRIHVCFFDIIGEFLHQKDPQGFQICPLEALQTIPSPPPPPTFTSLFLVWDPSDGYLSLITNPLAWYLQVGDKDMVEEWGVSALGALQVTDGLR